MNRLTARAELRKTAANSARKNIPQRIPLYSMKGPPTISDSAMAMSNGVRLISAIEAMRKIRNPIGCKKMNQSDSRCTSTTRVRLRLWDITAMPSRATTIGSS